MQPTMIGAFGSWAAALVDDKPAAFSFRHDRWTDVESWRPAARQRFQEALAQPDTGHVPEVTIQQQTTFDGLHIERLSWQLPYGPPTEAIYLKPAGSTKKLPGILALHDHAIKKYFGKQKITRTGEIPHPLMIEHQQEYYGGRAWANEIAKRGYAVLVPDAFAFASRRVLLSDVSPEILPTPLPGESEIETYNRWAAAHEPIMAKSLFCAGTTWPGVFLAEDQRAQVLKEMAGLGGHILSLADVDADSSFGPGLPEAIRNVLYLPALQLMGYYRSLAKGLNPDQPHNLTAVVELDLTFAENLDL